jgi:hypothetical protein
MYASHAYEWPLDSTGLAAPERVYVSLRTIAQDRVFLRNNV